MSSKKKKKKIGCLLVLAELREKMPPYKAWTAAKIANELHKSVPAMRRYLRVLEDIGFLIVKKRGKVKYYTTPEAVRKWKEKHKK